MTEIYYNETTTVSMLIDDGAVKKLTDLLISKYENSKPYLPYVGPNEFWTLVSPELAHRIQQGLGERSHPNLTLCWIFNHLADSPIVALQDAADDSDSIQIYDPNFLQDPQDFYWTLLTRDFIEYVLQSDSLTPYAIKRLDSTLKDNEVEYDIDVPAIDPPADDDLIPLFVAGLIRTAERNPEIFAREIMILLNEEGFDPTALNRETIKTVLRTTKIAIGVPADL